MPARKLIPRGWVALAVVTGLAIAWSAYEGRRPARTLPWARDYATAMAAGKAQGKPLLIDFRADWCTFCARMDRTTWADRDVGSLAALFVPVQVDADRHPEIAGQYGVEGLPTVAFVAPSGKLLGRASGYRDAGEMLTAMREVLRRAGAASR